MHRLWSVKRCKDFDDVTLQMCANYVGTLFRATLDQGLLSRDLLRRMISFFKHENGMITSGKDVVFNLRCMLEGQTLSYGNITLLLNHLNRSAAMSSVLILKITLRKMFQRNTQPKLTLLKVQFFVTKWVTASPSNSRTFLASYSGYFCFIIIGGFRKMVRNDFWTAAFFKMFFFQSDSST